MYITPTYDENPLESINGTATVMSEKAFNARYPNGKISRKAKEYGKTFVCRRGCNTRTSTYTEEFKWEDVYDGTEESLGKLMKRLENDTTATRKKRPEKRKVADDDFTGVDVADSDLEQETPRKKQKFSSAASTPRKIRTPSKLLTPRHKRYICPVFVFLYSNILQSDRQETPRIHTPRNSCLRS
jgi:origin recognition complex subunit 1